MGTAGRPTSSSNNGNPVGGATNAASAAHPHHHSHSHSHAQGACCSTHTHHQPMLTVNDEKEFIQKPMPNIQLGLAMLVQHGPLDVFQRLIEALDEKHENNLFQQMDFVYDNKGHTLLHWAAKRTDNPQFVHFLLPYYAPHLQQLQTRDDSKMTPLHWACTEEGSTATHNKQQPNVLPLVKALLAAAPYWLEERDASGCTPLLIAAQYGCVTTAAYLLQHYNCQLSAQDFSKDTAIHWAAYKGSVPILGLLLYYHKRQEHHGILLKCDSYQQTPVHLAALRGNVSACRYMLESLSVQDQSKVLKQVDSNGRTPLELARYKQQPHVVHFLQEYEDRLTPFHNQRWYLRTLQSTCTKIIQVNTWKQWLGLLDPDDSPKIPYYYVWSQYILHLFFLNTILYPWTHTADGRLWDYTGMLLIQHLLLFSNVYFLHRISTTDPGRIVANNIRDRKPRSKVATNLLNRLRQEYEQALEALADLDVEESSTTTKKPSPQLCHTCHIVRPPRSKHDRYSRSCVLMFDHHCPFTSNTIGLYNYSHFYFFLLSMTCFLIGFWYIFIVYMSRASVTSLPVLILGLFLGLNIIMPAGMLYYHTLLTLHNFTTNEQILTHRYDYFWELDSRGQRHFRNPWNKGRWANFMERIFYPGPQSYQLSSQHQSLMGDIETV